METKLNYNPHNAFAHYFNNDELAPYLYALSKKMEEGHICLDLNDITNDDKTNKDKFWKDFSGIELNENNFDFTDCSLVNSIDTSLPKPFVFINDKLYTERYFFYETKIINKLSALTSIKPDEIERRRQNLINAHSFLESLQSNDRDLSSFSKEELIDWQLVAVIQGFLNNLTIITGGPGTGKTTTVAKVLALLNKINPDLKVALAAPTGKAAVRMKQSLLKSSSENTNLAINELINKLNPKTIHRLLGYNFKSPFFKANAKQILDYDVIIIDESSMIGASLFSKLLDAIGSETRLILLGDSEQLASVDSGSLFGDLCKALALNENKFKKLNLDFLNTFLHTDRKISDEYELKNSNSFLNEHLVRLKKTYRYESNSKMGRFTKAVIDGHQNQLESIASIDEESLKIDVDYKDAIFIDFIKKYTMYICEPDIKIALEKFNDCRVLCAVRQSDKGVYKINEKIVNYLKKYSREHQLNFIPSTDFYENQPIMVTKNLDALNLFNGDVGIIRKSQWHNNRLMAFFPIGNETDYGAIKDIDIKAINPGFISDWELVFAMTIHKSQGSEFKDVLVILPNKEENKLLTRELRYTAITRAKKGGVAIIQATMSIINKTTSQKVNRVSGIVERIQLPK